MKQELNQSIKFIISVAHCRLDFTINSSIQIKKYKRTLLNVNTTKITIVDETRECLSRRKHCMLAVVRRSQKFRPAADPLPGGVGWPKFNQLKMVTTFTYKPSLVTIDARNFELSW